MAVIDYANARAAAMRGRLLGRRGVADLLAQADLEARLALLARTDYGPAIARHLAAAPDPLTGAERGLAARLSEDQAALDRFLRGDRRRALFRAMLAFADGLALKTVLRGLDRGARPERILPLLAPTPSLDRPALEALVGEGSVRRAIDLLVTWRSPYGIPLLTAWPDYERRKELLLLEAALDRALFARAFAAARTGGGDGRLLLPLLAERVDLTNAATLLKLAGAPGAREFFLPGGRLLDAARYAAFAALPAGALREALAHAGRRGRQRWLAAMAEAADPFDLDQAARRAAASSVAALARREPLSLAVPLAFLAEREAEVRRLRLVLRGAAFGIRAERLVALVGVT